jgi:glycosyltransferase involved in cell wall biosynthesis
MKISIFANSYLPNYGGVEKHIEKVCEQFLLDGHHIDLYYTTRSISLIPKSTNDIKYHAARLSKNKLLNRINAILMMIKNSKKITSSDIIHLQDFTPFYYYGLRWLSRIGILNRNKIFVTFHGWEGVFPPSEKVINLRKTVEINTSGNLCIGNYITKWYGTNPNIISIGAVDKFYVSETAKQNKRKILYIGRLEYDAGIVQYFDAYIRLLNDFPDLELSICGSGSLQEYLNSKVKSLNLINVSLNGFVSDISKYMSDASVIYTSGYLSILESFSASIPVVSIYDNELKHDYLKSVPDYQNMFWITSGDTNDIALATIEAINDNAKVYNAKKFADQQTWSKMASEYYKLWAN